MRIFKLISFTFLIFTIAFTSGCKFSKSNNLNNLQQNTINIYGSTSVEPLISALGEEYAIKNPNIEVIVQGIGSSEGIKAVIDGTTEIGTSSRDLNEQEKKFGLKETIIAYDGIAVIVNKENPVKKLTKEQIKNIFMGKITNWKTVGGNDAPIILTNREESSGTRGAFQDLFELEQKDAAGNKHSLLSPKTLITDSTGGIKYIVAGNKNAIGYISFVAIDNNTYPLTIDNASATIENVLNKSYKFQRSFILLTKDTPNDKLKQFYDFILSSEGKQIVKEEGFIPIN